MNNYSSQSAQTLTNEHLPFADFLSDQEVNALMESSSVVEYMRKDTILKQNSRVSHLPYIQSGLVKLSREMRKGKNIILRIGGPGLFLGLSSIIGGETFEFSVCALEPTTIRFYDNQSFCKLLESNGRFSHRVMQQVAKDDIFNVNRLSSLLYKQLPGRVADIILYFSQDIYGSPTFSIPLTRQELAELAGTTKESLIRTLSEFRNDKIIEMNRNRVTITSQSIVNTLSRLG